MSDGAQRILITGANGHIGQALIEGLCAGGSKGEARRVRALVRSERAAEQVRSLPGASAAEIVIGDYTSADSLRQATRGCDSIVHTVGIIKEGGGATYQAAHEDTCRVLAEMAAETRARRIVYLSILGSRPDSANCCLASKGRAEAILLGGRTPVTVLRVPMVLGPDDYASAALGAQARAKWTLLVAGGSSIQQPIDSRDVVSAILAAGRDVSSESVALDLGGPEQLAHRDLVKRAAALIGAEGPRVVPIPVMVGRLFAAVLGRVAQNPPITPAMFEILQHDDRVDVAAACDRLDLTLTPLDETLIFCVGPERTAA
ncbi:MAG: NAD(P)H-binding protein [Deltaproteobacteria bacterium]|jgi:NADH dehydrogenase|nr:NAD(P)H-binding protein [Deltaproteobacteria bacterium]